MGRFQSSAQNHSIIPSHVTRIPTVEEEEVIYPRSQTSGFGEKGKPDLVASQDFISPAAVTVVTSKNQRYGREWEVTEVYLPNAEVPTCSYDFA